MLSTGSNGAVGVWCHGISLPPLRPTRRPKTASVCATPTREYERIRNAQVQAEQDAAAKVVTIDSESAGSNLCSAVSDGFVGVVGSPKLVKALSAVAKDKLFENSVIDATKKLPLSKAQIKKMHKENSVTVHGILI